MPTIVAIRGIQDNLRIIHLENKVHALEHIVSTSQEAIASLQEFRDEFNNEDPGYCENNENIINLVREFSERNIKLIREFSNCEGSDEALSR